jgi:hypothetical protein
LYRLLKGNWTANIRRRERYWGFGRWTYTY